MLGICLVKVVEVDNFCAGTILSVRIGHLSVSVPQQWAFVPSPCGKLPLGSELEPNSSTLIGIFTAYVLIIRYSRKIFCL